MGEEADDFFAGVYEFMSAFDELETRNWHAMLCGSEEVVAALKAARKDWLEIWRELSALGEWRYIKAPLRTELLRAMRVDLGYADPAK
jgi:hypothetical protein